MSLKVDALLDQFESMTVDFAGFLMRFKKEIEPLERDISLSQRLRMAAIMAKFGESLGTPDDTLSDLLKDMGEMDG